MNRPQPLRAWRYRNVDHLPDFGPGVHTLDEPYYAYKGIEAGLGVNTAIHPVAKVVIPEGATVVVPNDGTGKYRTNELFVQRLSSLLITGKSPIRSNRSLFVGGPGLTYPLWTHIEDHNPLDTSLMKECTFGIHFCRTSDAAEMWGKM